MRVVWSWESPVNSAVKDIWACRRVNVAIRSKDASRAITGVQGRLKHHSYTIREKTVAIDMASLKQQKSEPTDDFWYLELSYEEKADYFPGREYSPKQRVGLVVELSDESARVSPQKFVQALNIANTFDRLAVQARVEPVTPIKI